jgi:hypothetical protein
MNYVNTAMYGTKNMKIMKFVIQETGTYNEQFKRPFTSGLDGQTFKTIIDTVDQARAITPSTMAGVANQFLRPSVSPESHIVIPNGWTNKRLRFFLEVQTESQMGAIQTEYVVGYTDHMGLSVSNNIDPNMRFYINAINVTRTTYQHTPLGNQVHQNLIDASHILINDQYTGVHTQNQVYGLRPEDVFTQMSSLDLQQEVGTDDFCDTRISITRTPQKSKRTNAVASSYTSDILNSFLQTARADRANENKSSLVETARATVKSESTSNDPFVSFIRNKNDGSGNTFTYADLITLDSTVVHNTVVLPMTHAMRAGLHEANTGTSNWTGSDGETMFATCVSQSVPGFMLEHCINKIHFVATNQDIGGRISIKIADVYSLMTGVDITPYVQSLCFKLEHELLKDLSFNGQMSFMLDVRCDLLCETWINISLNTGPMVTFVMPSFCDALMSPVTTTSVNNLTSLAKDFDSLIENIVDRSPTIGGMSANNFNLI